MSHLYKDWSDNEQEKPEDVVPIWRPSAYAVVPRLNSILMIKSKFSGMWEFPGGEVELHETLTEGCIREVNEETGYEITIKNKMPLHIEDTFFYAPNLDQYFRGLQMFFQGELSGMDKEFVMDTSEIEEVEWMDTAELRSYNLQNPTKRALTLSDLI